MDNPYVFGFWNFIPVYYFDKPSWRHIIIILLLFRWGRGRLPFRSFTFFPLPNRGGKILKIKTLEDKKNNPIFFLSKKTKINSPLIFWRDLRKYFPVGIKSENKNLMWRHGVRLRKYEREKESLYQISFFFYLFFSYLIK